MTLGFGTVTGSTFIPLNAVARWDVHIVNSSGNDGTWLYIGVAPSNINQLACVATPRSCGWYYCCYSSTLVSGPPYNYWNVHHGPNKEYGQYVQTGGTVGVVMDTVKGELSFVVNGVNLGVAYKNVPLNSPIVPCVAIGCDDTIELRNVSIDYLSD